MPVQRRISWNAALRDVHNDRNRVAPGVISARSLIQSLNRIRRTGLVTPTGAFDRTAIMAAAVEAAKAHHLRTGAVWSVCMSAGLTAAWQAAKAARRSVILREPIRAEYREEVSRPNRSRPLGPEWERDAADDPGASSPFSPSLLMHPPVTSFTQEVQPTAPARS